MTWENNPFNPISLAPNDKFVLITHANAFIDDALGEYGELLASQAKVPERRTWKLVRKRALLKIYRSTKRLIAVGNLTGDFDDVAYGFLNHTPEAIDIRRLHLDDNFGIGAVLAVVLSPSRTHPFHSMTVRWSVKNSSVLLRPALKHCDFVYIQATGTRVVTSGDLIGFDLLQSIQLDSAPHMPQYERSYVSQITLWKRVDRTQVRLLSCSLLPSCSTTIRSASHANSTSQRMLSLFKVITCAQQKKLLWLERNGQGIQGTGMKESERCELCNDSFRFVFIQRIRTCAICTKPMCSKCQVKHTIPDATRARRMHVCVECVGIGRNMSAAIIARNEASKARSQRHSEAMRKQQSRTHDRVYSDDR